MSNCQTEDIILEYEENDSEADESDNEIDGGSNDVRSVSQDLIRLSDDEDKNTTDKTDDKDKDDDKKKKSDKQKKPSGENKNYTLKAEHLKHPKKGIHQIEHYFENFKFLGKSKEQEDLDRIMKRMEHWAHRVYPKYSFDDFLEKTEQIGLKKQVQTFVTKYRMDMIDDIIEMNRLNNDLEEDEIDEEQQDLTSQKDQVYDEMLKQKSQNQSPATSALSDEIKERIERNRLQAIAKKKAKEAEKQKALMKEIEECELVVEDMDIDNTLWEDHQNVIPEEVLSMQEKIEMKRQMALAKKLAKQKEKQLQQIISKEQEIVTHNLNAIDQNKTDKSNVESFNLGEDNVEEVSNIVTEHSETLKISESKQNVNILNEDVEENKNN